MSSLADASCKYCSHLLSNVTVRHTILECQYRRSMYCPVCISYGHSPRMCPNKVAWAIRRGKKPTEKNIELKITNTDAAIKDVLKRNGIQPGTTQLENRKRLHDMANSMNPPQMIIFIN